MSWWETGRREWLLLSDQTTFENSAQFHSENLMHFMHILHTCTEILQHRMFKAWAGKWRVLPRIRKTGSQFQIKISDFYTLCYTKLFKTLPTTGKHTGCQKWALLGFKPCYLIMLVPWNKLTFEHKGKIGRHWGSDKITRGIFPNYFFFIIFFWLAKQKRHIWP